MNFLAMWWSVIKSRLSMRMAYRTEFFIALFSMAILEFTGPIIAFTIYFNTPGFEGWTFHQIILLQGVLMTIRGISFSLVMGIIWNSNFKLKDGTFDLILVKPRNLLLMFVADSFDSEDWIKVIGGIGLITFALSSLSNITVSGIVLMILFSLGGIVLLFSIALLFSAFIFRFVQTWRIYELLDIVLMVAQYPKTIYPKSVGIIFTGMIPVFIASVFPVQALFNQVQIDGLIALGSVIFIFIFSVCIWYRTIRNYSSAGG